MSSVRNTEFHFWSRVDIRQLDECWPWQGAVSRGYGYMMWQRKHALTHRLSAYFAGLTTQIAAPRDKKGDGFVMHTCDNRLCCNPKHLEIGSYAKNNRDAVTRGRKPDQSGERNPSAKLPRAAVHAIRHAFARGGVSQQALANLYGVSQSQVSAIIRNESWIKKER